jgi:hypothetical protein
LFHDRAKTAAGISYGRFHPEGIKSISPALTRPGRSTLGIPTNQNPLRRSCIFPEPTDHTAVKFNRHILAPGGIPAFRDGVEGIIPPGFLPHPKVYYEWRSDLESV